MNMVMAQKRMELQKKEEEKKEEEEKEEEAEFRTRTAWILESSLLMRHLADEEGDDTAMTGGHSLRARVKCCYPNFLVCGPDEKDWRVAATVVHQWSVAPLPYWFLDLFLRCPAAERSEMRAELTSLASDAGEGTAARAFWGGMLALVAPPPLSPSNLAAATKEFQKQREQDRKRKFREKEDGEVDEEAVLDNTAMDTDKVVVAEDADKDNDDEPALVFWRVAKACSVTRNKEEFAAYWTDHCLPRYDNAGYGAVLRRFDGVFHATCFRYVVVEPRCLLALAMTIDQFPDFVFELRALLYDSGWVAGLDMLYAKTGAFGFFLRASCPATFCWILAKADHFGVDLFATSSDSARFFKMCLTDSIRNMLHNGTFQTADWSKLSDVCAPSLMLRAFMYFIENLCSIDDGMPSLPALLPVIAAARCAYDAAAEQRTANNELLQRYTFRLTMQHHGSEMFQNFMDASLKMKALNDFGLMLWPAIDSETGARMFVESYTKYFFPSTFSNSPRRDRNDDDDDNDGDDDNQVNASYCRELWRMTDDLRTFGWFRRAEQLRPLAVRLSRGVKYHQVAARESQERTVYLAISVEQFMRAIELRFIDIPHADDDDV